MATRIPGLNVRRATTTVELRDGQSFMIAGLLQGTNLSDTQGLPWVGNVPVLGTLFRSESYKKNETDLVILVTPRLIRPWCPATRSRRPWTTEDLRMMPSSSLAASRKFKSATRNSLAVISSIVEPRGEQPVESVRSK